MIGVDTNVLARLFLDDDARQSALAKRFFDARTTDDPAFLSAIVMAEFVWLLASRYRYPVDTIHAALSVIFGSGNVVVEREEQLKEAVSSARHTGGDISDAIIAAVAVHAGCSSVVTFDKDAARLVPNIKDIMETIEKIGVPLVVEAKAGKNWEEMRPV